MAVLVAAMPGKPKGAPGKPLADKGMPKDDDALERTYFQQAIDAFRGGDDDAAVDALIKGVRACVQKEMDEAY